MAAKLPKMIVTGASGIVGRGFLEAAKDEYLIYAIARRSQKEAGVPEHPNIKWIQVDIGNWLSLRWVMHNIKRKGGADYVFHLAAYYDFEYKDHPEYERTNVKGTRYMLEQCKILGIKRFVFASTTAACDFPKRGETINEKTPVDADYAYAWAKKKGEQMVREFSKLFPCSIVRFAAVYSDWCEYGVLYTFLETWLGKKWNSRVLGGKGESAVPFIHTKDLSKMVLTLFGNSEQLPRFDTYIASPDGSTSHRELYETAVRLYYGKRIRPFFVPKILALPGVIARDLLGRLIGKRPFERPWMIKYLDYKLDIDAAYTRNVLSWEPTPRYHVLRRLIFLIEKMKSDPFEWHRKNVIVMDRTPLRPNILIYEIMLRIKNESIDEIKKVILDPARSSEFPNYQQMDQNNLNWYVNVIYQLLYASVRNNDRTLLLDYIKDLCQVRFKEGFSKKEICNTLFCIGETTVLKLNTQPELKKLKQEIHDYISITIQMTVDEVEDVFEEIERLEAISKRMEIKEIESKIDQMETFYRSTAEEEDRLQ